MPYYRCAVYNKEFARVIINAYILGETSAIYNKHIYKVKDYIQGIHDDIKQGFYKIVIK